VREAVCAVLCKPGVKTEVAVVCGEPARPQTRRGEVHERGGMRESERSERGRIARGAVCVER